MPHMTLERKFDSIFTYDVSEQPLSFYWLIKFGQYSYKWTPLGNCLAKIYTLITKEAQV